MRALHLVKKIQLSSIEKSEKGLLSNYLAKLEDDLDKIFLASCTKKEAYNKQIDFVRHAIDECKGGGVKKKYEAVLLKLAKLEHSRTLLYVDRDDFSIHECKLK